MKTKIQNQDDLRAERTRLNNQIQVAKAKMRNEFTAIKTELNPARQAVGVIGDIFTAPQKGLLNMGIGLGVDTILRRGLLSRAGWVTKLIVPFLVRNVASNYISKNRESVVENLLGWVKNATEKQPAKTAEKPVEMIDFKHNGTKMISQN